MISHFLLPGFYEHIEVMEVIKCLLAFYIATGYGSHLYQLDLFMAVHKFALQKDTNFHFQCDVWYNFHRYNCTQ